MWRAPIDIIVRFQLRSQGAEIFFRSSCTGRKNLSIYTIGAYCHPVLDLFYQGYAFQVDADRFGHGDRAIKIA